MATSNPSAPNRTGWRGGKQQTVARHRWQRDPAAATSGRILAREPWRSIRIVVMFLLAGGLLALLIYYLLYAPSRTPVLTIVATDYAWPLPPNAWAKEDVAALADLDKQTLGVRDLSENWRSPDRGLEQLTAELQAFAHRRTTQPIILWISMHGAVDGAGRPCLIPPGASPHESETWLTLSSVFERIKAAGLPAGKPVLVVLDANRQLVNWHTGMLANTLADALPAAVEEAGIPGLVVLNSAGPGEAAVSSSQIRGSVFGHYVRLGLAGAADAWANHGDGNGRVSIRELTHYLQAQVHARAVHHRAMPQRPMLAPADARNFDVAFALRASSWRGLVERGKRIERAPPSVASQRLGALWKQHDRLRDGRLWRLDPVAWRNVEQDLLWLEQLAEAGSAYEAEAKSLADQLHQSLSEAQSRLEVAEASHSLPAYQAVLSPYRPKWQVQAHSLPLGQFLGTIDPAASRALAAQLATCRQAPSDSALRGVLAAFEQAKLPGGTTENNLLGRWQRYHVPAQWPDAEILGDVLAARLTAERLAAPVTEGELPGDERAHAWVRPKAEALDKLCRQLEDGAVLGPQAGDLAEQRAAAAAAAEEAETASRQAGEALALRDRLWAELPYLAAWLARPQFDPAVEQEADLAVRQSLLPLIADGLALEEQLTRREPTADSPATWAAQAMADSAGEKLGELSNRFQAAVRALQSAGASPQAVADIDAALATPLIAWDARQQLRQKRADLLADLTGQFRAAGERPTAEEEKQTAAESIDHAERITTRWPQHPLVALLARVPAKEAAADDLPALGEQVRRQLLTLSHDDLTRAPSDDTPPGTPGEPAAEGAAASDLAALCQAESLVRTASALWFDPPGVDPVEALRQADLQQLLLWQARRALDDFAGPSGAGQEPLFAVAAGDYLAAARSIAPLSPAAEEQAQSLSELLAKRRVAAIESLATSASDILLVDQATTVSSTILVRAKLAESLADLPAAQGAVFLADDQGRIGPNAWPLPQAAAADGSLLRQELLLEAASLRERGPLIHTIATLRGNEFPAPLLLRAPGGARVAYRRPNYGPPRVTVFGFDKKRASVVFVLDCSFSMKEPTRVERPDVTNQPQVSRMDVAKGALRSMLEQLAERGNARVGVRLFGHRVGWSTIEENKLLRQTGYSDEIPTTLRPYADVESILPLGRFDSVVAGGVYEKLAAVQPWGETPLYLALTQAVADFTTEDDAERSIVVITDGRNNQFNPPTEFQRTKDDVLAAARRAQVPITIVGFEIPAAEAATASREFEEIATETGGAYLPATGATAFVQALESLLRPGEFRVTASGGPVLERAELGTSVSLPRSTTPQEYVVGFESLREQVELTGGEAAELVVRRDLNRLAVPAFLRGNPRFERMVAEDGGPTLLQAGVHRTMRSQETVTFQVSLQHTDQHFVPRPAETWIEVTPQGTLDEESVVPFIFYDIPPEPGTSVPLLNLPAYGWPAGATRAQVRIWSKRGATLPTHSVPLAEVADRVPAEGAGYDVPGIAGVTYQARTAGGAGQALLVGLVERHDAASPGIDAMRVELSPPPDQAIHQFDPRNRVVLHAFTYERPAGDLKSNLQVRFTSKTAAHSGADHLSQPVVVDVSDRADLLEITPPAKP
jgi:hypothetical protein